MIVSHILGGIGNQMFQYAAGRSLSLHLNDYYTLDLKDFDRYALHHGYELKRVFDVPIEPTSPDELRSVLGLRRLSLLKKILRRRQFSILRGQKFIVEPHFNFWPKFFSLKSGSYLHGYWQSEKYFKSIEKVIRDDFSFKKPLAEKNLLISNQIHQTNAVSLHISDAKTNRIMSVCDISYYERAISYMAAKVSNPVFYVFSDDMDWVKQSISIAYPTAYIDHNRGEDSYVDMQLMSLCDHHIIANSSFSWWGAWLNPSAKKIVVVPRLWFKNGNNDSDLIPNEWIRL
jgi:Glycosyl transferase family 11